MEVEQGGSGSGGFGFASNDEEKKMKEKFIDSLNVCVVASNIWRPSHFMLFLPLQSRQEGSNTLPTECGDKHQIIGPPVSLLIRWMESDRLQETTTVLQERKLFAKTLPNSQRIHFH